MGLFSGIMVNAEEKGYELSMEDVRIEFNQAFEVLNAEAASFESFCGAVEKLELLNASIQANGGKADKSLIAFLNQNNGLADALGIDLSMEDFNDVVVGSEVSAACEGALANLWEAIKNFFKNIWDGIVNFFKNLFGMFSSAEKKAAQAAQNAGKIAENIATGAGGSSSRFKITGDGSPTGCMCVKIDAFKAKAANLIELGNQFAKITNVETAIMEFMTGDKSAIAKPFQALNISYKNGEPVMGSIWRPNEIIAGSKTVGDAFKAAGWTQDSIANLQAQAKSLREAGANIQKGSAVIEQFNKLNDEQILAIMKDKLGEKNDNNLKSVKKVGKHVIYASKIIGQFAKDFIALLDDINSLSEAQKAAENAEAAKAEQAKKDAEAKAQQANKL